MVRKIPHLHSVGQTPENCLICQGKMDFTKKNADEIRKFKADFRKGKYQKCPECGKNRWRFDRENQAVCTECGLVVEF